LIVRGLQLVEQDRFLVHRTFLLAPCVTADAEQQHNRDFLHHCQHPPDLFLSAVYVAGTRRQPATFLGMV
jgi:hypothetical protein